MRPARVGGLHIFDDGLPGRAPPGELDPPGHHLAEIEPVQLPFGPGAHRFAPPFRERRERPRQKFVLGRDPARNRRNECAGRRVEPHILAESHAADRIRRRQVARLDPAKPLRLKTAAIGAFDLGPDGRRPFPGLDQHLKLAAAGKPVTVIIKQRLRAADRPGPQDFSAGPQLIKLIGVNPDSGAAPWQPATECHIFIAVPGNSGRSEKPHTDLPRFRGGAAYAPAPPVSLLSKYYTGKRFQCQLFAVIIPVDFLQKFTFRRHPRSNAKSRADAAAIRKTEAAAVFRARNCNGM